MLSLFNFSRYLVAIALLFANLSFPPHLLARFLEEDSEVVENLNPGREHEADLLVYRPLPGMETRGSNQHYFTSVGSLSVNDFSTNESLQLQFGSLENLKFGLRKVHQDDLNYRREFTQLRFAHRLGEGLELSIIGEPVSDKEHADIGAGFAYQLGAEHRLSLDYLSIDHSYNEKTSDVGLDLAGGEHRNRFSRRPTEMTAIWQWQLQNKQKYELQWSIDSPMRWWRYSKKQRYDQWQNSLLAVASTPLADGLLRFSAKHYQFDEAIISWNGGEKCQSEKSNYQQQFIDIRHDSTTTIGQLPNQQYGLKIFSHRQSVLCDEAESALLTERREIMPYALYSSSFSGSDWLYHAGSVVSFLQEPQQTEAVYAVVKAQLGWSWHWRYQQGSLLNAAVNSSWDLDHLYTAYPYHQEPLLPWDGGNVQVSAVF